MRMRVTQSSLPDEPATFTYDGRGLLSYHLIQHHHGDQTEINRYYSGDGREGKRTKRKYTNDPEATSPPYGTWADEPTVYYIRSSVFGGQVISETHPTGAKKKTFVLAAEALIATQSEYTYSSTTAESVSFEHFDASGMSFRTSSSTGTVISGDGSFDGQPGEMDPMGAMPGFRLRTSLIQPPPDPTENFPFFPILQDAPMYFNGQQVRCSLDGISVSCGSALQV